MTTLNRAQRVALKRVYDRTPLNENARTASEGERRISYREFRRKVQAGWDCVMIYWCGMWLGIERDGYTHS